LTNRIETNPTEKKKPVRHGLRGTPEYCAWVEMRRRCRAKNRKEFALYGERGISVCKAWEESFLAFLRDMGNRPSSLHSIDRRDNNLGYFKENCRWATDVQQSNNRRSTVLLTLNGETMSVAEWARKLNVFKMTLIKRKNRGWTDEQILTTPIRNMGRSWNGKWN
jgi:hypothetical protein